MNNKDIIQSVSQKAALTKQATEQLLRSTVQIITETLNEGGDVKIQHFGSLEVRAHQARIVTNPRNGQKTEIPAKDVWTFKANTRLKDAVNNK
ncbi:MAG: HU family DNA-binding protein [Paludibacteraceae bacterium]|nr:HU family DNA-binding protein [Paludibacteraceae bacterium]